METRKVQMTGGSSLMITLPKDWASSSGVKKNDTLGLFPQPDGSLVVSPVSNDQTVRTNKRIDCDDIHDADLLFRMLVGAYMSGYSVVEIVSRSRITDKVRKTVEMMTQSAIGVEIIEEYDDRMILKDLVDPAEMRMDRTLGRMRSLVSNMISDAIRAFYENDTELLDAVISRDSDVDRLEWLVARQTNMAHRDPGISRKMSMDLKEMMMHHIVCRLIERIGDHAVMIAKNSKLLLKNKISDDVRNGIMEIGEKTGEIFNRSVRSLVETNFNDANAIITEGELLADRCKNINRHVMNEDFDSVLPASLIAGSLRRINEYSVDIAEHTINAAM